MGLICSKQYAAMERLLKKCLIKHKPTRASILKESFNLAKKKQLEDKEKGFIQTHTHLSEASPQPRSKDDPGNKTAKQSKVSTPTVTNNVGAAFQIGDVVKTSGQPKTRKATGQRAITPKSTRTRDNLDFYSNSLRAQPSGKTIKEILQWRGDYRKLESNHGYIQWLFPILEGGGVNRFAQPLQEHEALAIKSNEAMRMRVQQAYQMMLDFYGMELARDDGSIRRCKANWKDRYAHLNRSRHNYLRITRIIKSLGLLGYEHFQLPWVKFLIEEAFSDYGELPGVRSSVLYWVYAINDETEQATICTQLARYGIYGPEEGLNSEPVPDYDSEDDSEGEDESQAEYGATGIGHMEAQVETSESSNVKASQKSQTLTGDIDNVKVTTV
ncbi:opioid growth factor receptor-like protein 1 isoform X2 [Dreissena polymorpha]|uniref:opioid growth factor receptor-like protein 1 isoform X2 n=1 Tax=Dreissena polymorpha TaxID=45954 RepID=UPI0022644D86|nr:opioid growth factor receptor-like protein 1 isoform X2 [Dreissena polymorpha]